MPKLFVVVGLSGIGKSYLMHRLTSMYPQVIESPFLLTTRPMRPGEVLHDRKFVEPADFKLMESSGKFVWTGSFYGNNYGYTKNAIEPKNKHLVVNALPPMIEEFSKLPSVCMVGLTIKQEKLNLLIERLQKRGDPVEAIEKRQAAWQEDLRLMNDNTTLINKHGRLFIIEDDSTIESIVIPYLSSLIET